MGRIAPGLEGTNQKFVEFVRLQGSILNVIVNVLNNFKPLDCHCESRPGGMNLMRLPRRPAERGTPRNDYFTLPFTIVSFGC